MYKTRMLVNNPVCHAIFILLEYTLLVRGTKASPYSLPSSIEELSRHFREDKVAVGIITTEGQLAEITGFGLSILFVWILVEASSKMPGEEYDILKVTNLPLGDSTEEAVEGQLRIQEDVQMCHKEGKEAMNNVYVDWLKNSADLLDLTFQIFQHPSPLTVYEYEPDDTPVYLDLHVEMEAFRIPKQDEFIAYMKKFQKEPLVFVEIISEPGQTGEIMDFKAKLLCIAGSEFVVIFDMTKLDPLRAFDMFTRQNQVVVMDNALPSLMALHSTGLFLPHPPLDLSVLAPFGTTDAKLYSDSIQAYKRVSHYYMDVQGDPTYSVVIPNWDQQGVLLESNNLGHAIRTRFRNLKAAWEVITEKAHVQNSVLTMLKSAWVKTMYVTAHVHVSRGCAPRLPMIANMNDLNDFQRRFVRAAYIYLLVLRGFNTNSPFPQHSQELFTFSRYINEGMDMATIVELLHRFQQQGGGLVDFEPETILGAMSYPDLLLHTTFNVAF